MPPRRRVSTRAHPVSVDESEQIDSGPDTQSKVRELRAQVAGLSEAYQRQSEQLDRMMQLSEQRAPSIALPVETIFVAAFLVASLEPVAPSVPKTSAVSLRKGRQLSVDEQRDITDRLSRYRQFDPP